MKYFQNLFIEFGRHLKAYKMVVKKFHQKLFLRSKIQKNWFFKHIDHIFTYNSSLMKKFRQKMFQTYVYWLFKQFWSPMPTSKNRRKRTKIPLKILKHRKMPIFLFFKNKFKNFIQYLKKNLGLKSI